VRAQDLGYSPFDMVSQCHHPVKSDSKMCYSICKGNVSSGCSILLGTLESSGEIDCLTFPFIDLYVPAFTSRIHCSESVLQFAENKTFIFLYRINTGIIRKQQDGFQVSWGHHLHIDCTILGQGWNLEKPLLLFFLP
jgi:hypothetical protein